MKAIESLLLSHFYLPSKLSYCCGSGILPRNDRGWKPLPQKQDLLDDKGALRAVNR
jgi:hypothetical protein